MSENKNKTKPTPQTSAAFIKTLKNEVVRSQAKELVQIFEEVTKTKCVMWGNIFGFGSYHYKYESGREGDFLATGFAMRKSDPTIYSMSDYEDYRELLENIGPRKLGKSCLYVKKLDDLHIPTLKKLIRTGLRDLKKTYPVTLK
jgi:hypothetical protein